MKPPPLSITDLSELKLENNGVTFQYLQWYLEMNEKVEDQTNQSGKPARD